MRQNRAAQLVYDCEQCRLHLANLETQPEGGEPEFGGEP